MSKAVLDSTVLLSAFLTKGGVSAELLHKSAEGSFTICLAEEILNETERVLLTSKRIRKKYAYTDDAVKQYTQGLRVVSTMVTDLPTLQVVRDPNDDMIVACGVKAKADYIITRDKDLLTLAAYQHITMIAPEEFMELLRK